MAFSHDGTKIASGSYDSTVRIWDAASGVSIRTLTKHSGSVLSVAFSPDGTKIASGSYDRTVRIWDAATGAFLRTLTGHIGLVYSVAFSPDGTRIASGCGDRTVRFWDIALCPSAYYLSTSRASCISCPRGTYSSMIGATSLSSHAVRVWDVLNLGRRNLCNCLQSLPAWHCCAPKWQCGMSSLWGRKVHGSGWSNCVP
jgi:WD40 repeat protein